MAKIGIEIEGVYHQGDSTLFCSAEEYLNKRTGIAKVLNSGIVSHIYISDHQCVLNLDNLANYMMENHGEIDTTVELTQLKDFPPARIRIMYNASNHSPVEIIATAEHLRDTIDQVKIDFELTCMVAPIEAFAWTSPEQFENDIEISL